MHNKYITAALLALVVIRLVMRFRSRKAKSAGANIPVQYASPELAGTRVAQREASTPIRNTWLIAKREFIARVATKGFVAMTLLVPGIACIAFGIIYVTSTHMGGNQTLVVASDDMTLAQNVRTELIAHRGNNGMVVNVISPATDPAMKQLVQQVSDKSIDGYIYLEAQANAAPKVTYASRTSADISGSGRIQDAVSNAYLRERLAARGVPTTESDALLKPIDVGTVQVKDGQQVSSNSTQSFIAAYAMMFLLYFSVTYYAMNTARSVVQEKSSRIFEVMLATVRPEETMAGKMLGVGGAGMLQILIWGLTVVPLRIALMARASGSELHISVSPWQLIMFAIYFVLGFLLYSSMAAALGATVSAEQEVQQFAFPLVMPLFVAFVSYMYILSAPNSAYAVTLSLFPFTAPIAMLLRVSSQMPPLWQIALSVAILAFTIYLVLLLAARIYRVGILMYGKRPTLPEIIRWLRYA